MESGSHYRKSPERPWKKSGQAVEKPSTEVSSPEAAAQQEPIERELQEAKDRDANRGKRISGLQDFLEDRRKKQRDELDQND